MKTLLTVALSLFAALPAAAGGGGFFNGGGGGGASSSSGTLVDGANARFKSVTAEILATTGTAPSATLNGAVFKGTVTVLATADTAFNTYGYATEGGAGIDSGEIGIAKKASGGIRIGFNGNTGGNAFWDLINAGAHIWRYSGTTEAMRLTNAGFLGLGTASPASKLHVSGGNVLVSSGALQTEGAIARPLELGARTSDGTFSTFTVTSNGIMFLNVLNSASALPTVPGLWVRDLNGVATPVIGFHQADDYRRGVRNPGGNRDVDIFTQNADGDGNVNVYTGNNTLTASFRDTGGFRLYSRTIAQLKAITPDAVGESFYCNNCTPAKIVVSTGTSAGNFADAIGGAFQ